MDTPETDSTVAALSPEELTEAWPVMSAADRLEGFQLLPRAEAADFFAGLAARDQGELILGLKPAERRTWMRLLPPDDAADLVQESEPEERPGLLALLDEATRKEVTALLAYAEDAAGGLMSPRFARLRPEMSVDEAISYLRRQTRERVETIYYVYVLDHEQRLLGVVSLRELFQAPPGQQVRDVMRSDVVTVHENMDQEKVSAVFREHDLVVIPVVSETGRMVGIVTVDDIADVVEEEATEDIHKVGGLEALDAPYFETSFAPMLRKRAGWLTLLFVGEMLTASVMGVFAGEIASAVVLTLFLPLIISSGGNSGSQASTLVIRAMALGEVRLRDWWRVLGREVSSGIALGAILGTIGLLRIVAWEQLFGAYGEHYLLLGLTVSLTLVGIVLWGTVSGSMLPFVLRRFGFDPASASAPFVATLVDVTGVVMYFTLAALLLRGSLL